MCLGSHAWTRDSRARVVPQRDAHPAAPQRGRGVADAAGGGVRHRAGEGGPLPGPLPPLLDVCAVHGGRGLLRGVLRSAAEETRVPGEGDDLESIFPGDVVARLDGSGSKNDHAEFGRRIRMSGATDYLRTQALSRLYLDNVYSIGASWVTMGPHIGQVALAWGANDMGSVMMEENVVSASGTKKTMASIAELKGAILQSGFVPALRDSEYNILEVSEVEANPLEV